MAGFSEDASRARLRLPAAGATCSLGSVGRLLPWAGFFLNHVPLAVFGLLSSHIGLVGVCGRHRSLCFLGSD